MSTPIFFNQLSISLNLHQYRKTQVFLSFCSRDIVNLKILQFDWWRAFWPISQEPEFSQVWFLSKNTANIMKIFCRPNSKKLMTQFSSKFKKPCFWPIFGPFFLIFQLHYFSPFYGTEKIKSNKIAIMNM